MNDALKQVLVNRTLLSHRVPSSQESIELSIPANVQHFHSLYPLDEPRRIQIGSTGTLSKDESSSSSSSLSGVVTTSKICSSIVSHVYKAINSMNGTACILRRVPTVSAFDDTRLKLPSWEFANRYVDIWKQLKHPNIVGLQSIFSTSEFLSSSTSTSHPDWVFVYDYFVGGESLESLYRVNAVRAPPEHILWSFICQIVSALKAIHASNLAYRSLHPSKVLLLPSNRRIKLNCVGLLDVLNPVQAQDDDSGGSSDQSQLDEEQIDNIYYDRLAELQDRDIMDLGYLILDLAAKSNDAKVHADKRLYEIENVYSEELIDMIKYLISENDEEEEWKNIDDVVAMLATRYQEENVAMYQQNDYLEDELVKEMDNGRLLRLLVKLNFAVQYAEEQQRFTNADSGDAHVLLLFSDYLFRQVNPDGSPVIDYGHIIETLNKLDAGTHEKLLLMTKDEQSLIVASYKELKKSVNQIFKFFFEL